MEHLVDAVGDLTGVHLNELPPTTTLRVWTSNSSYEIVVIDGSHIYVQGGTSFPDFTPAYLDGCSTGHLLKVGWICVGYAMRLRAGALHVVTSPVRAITTQRPGIPIVPYKRRFDGGNN